MSITENGFNWWSLIIGIIYIVLGILAFNNPLGSASFVIYLFAFAVAFKGIAQIIIRNRLKEYSGMTNNWMIVIGIIDIIIGVFLFFNVTAVFIALPIVFAMWFIIDSVIALISARTIRKYSKRNFWLIVFLSIISIIIGIILIFNPIASILTVAYLVGIYFTLNGLSFVIQAF
ncbi:HdeD family acid-resistance protein [Ruoffia tabacinasalis]|uniref:DUF308 domain-containing protein n=1 Tax=Ruoffia tabacinasalis TaxID=87458 RepID=A0ABS0LLJ8_9LACT|nr:DUF308 domain-containing protein [Ruoffia tabacinasalis]MBG9979161.1 DUF308 domain-containing protein [Ruoffia tabacinasalis]